jgi:hypothetical protein
LFHVKRGDQKQWKKHCCHILCNLLQHYDSPAAVTRRQAGTMNIFKHQMQGAFLSIWVKADKSRPADLIWLDNTFQPAYNNILKLQQNIYILCLLHFWMWLRIDNFNRPLRLGSVPKYGNRTSLWNCAFWE